MKTIGYIVEGPSGSYSLGKYGDEKGILFLNGPAHLFDTRKQAKAAIKRSIAYQDRHNYNWTWMLASYPRRVESNVKPV
jgi:hypothetical protein